MPNQAGQEHCHDQYQQDAQDVTARNGRIAHREQSDIGQACYPKIGCFHAATDARQPGFEYARVFGGGVVHGARQ